MSDEQAESLQKRARIELESAKVSRAPTDDEVKTKWDAMTELYNLHFRLWSAPALSSIVSALSLCDAKSCLEVACGPGHALSALRAELPSDATLFACDYSSSMVAEATTRAEKASAVLFEGDAQMLSRHPEMPPQGVDRLVANLVIHLIPDADKALRSFFRALAPGGHMAASVWGTRADSPMFTILEQAVANLGSALPSGTPASTPLRSNFHLGADDSALRARVQAAGFERVVSWHVACVWPVGVVGGPEAFAASWMMANPGAVALAKTLKLSETQREALTKEMGRLARKLMDAGAPMACDVVIVTGRKPLSGK